MTTQCAEEREISISWFTELTGVLGKYLAVLRYELEQSGITQTLEALIHAEIVKLLIRQFTSGCVQTEYQIGQHFKKGINKNNNEFARKLRADIAIFHPISDSTRAAVRPIAVIELKRTGNEKALRDDIYRLAVVSLKTCATGYFVFAGPKAHVKKTINGLSLLKQMERSADSDATQDGPHEFSFAQMKTCSLYDSANHPGTERFYGQRMFSDQNASEEDGYSVRIFAFHVEREMIAKKIGQRLSLKVTNLDRPMRPSASQSLPRIE